MLKSIILVFIIIILFAVLSFGFVIGRYHYKKQSYVNYWAEKAKSDGELVYVALGDSSATGIGASAPSKSYVGRIASMMEEKTGKKVKIINLSVPGAKTQDLIDIQLPQLSKIKNPNLVTISIGANDTNHDIDPNVTVKNFETIISKIPNGSYLAEIPALRGKDKNKTEIINTKLKLMAFRNKMHVVPLYSALYEHKNDLSIYDLDFFHPNDKGYGIWTDAFWSTINR